MKASTRVGILILSTCLLIPPGANAQVEQLYGTWRLGSFVREVVGSGERTDVFGKAPQGFLHYGGDGRMSVIIVKENRPKPTEWLKMTDQERAELFRTMNAYAGTFKVEGSPVVAPACSRRPCRGGHDPARLSGSRSSTPAEDPQATAPADEAL